MYFKHPDGHLMQFQMFRWHQGDETAVSTTHIFVCWPYLMNMEQVFYTGVVAFHRMKERLGIPEATILDLWFGPKHRLWIIIPDNWPAWPIRAQLTSYEDMVR